MPPSPRPSRREQAAPLVRRAWRYWLAALAVLTSLAALAADVANVIDIFGTKPSVARPAPSHTTAAPTVPPPASPSPRETAPPSPDPTAERTGPTPTPTRTGKPATSPTTAPPSPPPRERVSSFVVHKGTWVDLDPRPPAMSATHEAGSDVLFGPDNAYSDPARIWPDDGSATCAVQAAGNGRRGYQEKMDLHGLLSAAPDGVVSACAVTSDDAVLSLRITSEKGDDWAPFRVEIVR